MIINSDFKHLNICGRIVSAIFAKCDSCGIKFVMSKRKMHEQQKKTGLDLTFCPRCRCKQTIKDKPQCSKAFWSADKKREHGKIMKNSEKHRQSRKVLSVVFRGSGNPMFGKKLTTEMRHKMSVARIGKIGEKATAWKGGDFSILNSIKRHLKVVIKWNKKVCERDGNKCVVCGSEEKISAHHIVPISEIVYRLLAGRSFKTKEEQYEYLIHTETVVDPRLENGVALCKKCHKHIHTNWGSHRSKAMTIEELKEYYKEHKNEWQ